MLNKSILQGRVVKTPELRRTTNGTPVVIVGLAVERDFKRQDGDRETDFLDVIAWSGTAEFISKYFSKGKMMIVEGRLQSREYKDKNGNNRRAVEIVAGSVYFGDSKKDKGDATSAEEAPGPKHTQGFEEIRDEGELPF